MLQLNLLTRDELIQLLTKNKGKLSETTYLITISDPEDQQVVFSKYNILSLQFNKNLGPFGLHINQARDIFMFLKHIATEAETKEISLIISSPDADNRAGSIIALITEIMDNKILDFDHLKSKNFDVKVDSIIFVKLYLPIAAEINNTAPF